MERFTEQFDALTDLARPLLAPAIFAVMVGCRTNTNIVATVDTNGKGTSDVRFFDSGVDAKVQDAVFKETFGFNPNSLPLDVKVDVIVDLNNNGSPEIKWLRKEVLISQEDWCGVLDGLTTNCGFNFTDETWCPSDTGLQVDDSDIDDSGADQESSNKAQTVVCEE